MLARTRAGGSPADNRLNPDDRWCDHERLPVSRMTLACMLSQRQKQIIVAGLVALGFLTTYLPWTYTFYTSAVHREKPGGYHWIFDPPQPESNLGGAGVKVDVPRVLIPMAVVIVAMIAGIALVDGRTDKKG